MNLLLLDFETWDKAMGLDLGPGYIFPNLFKILGWSSAFLNLDTGKVSDPIYTDSLSITSDIGILYSDIAIKTLKNNITKTDGIIAHNSSYELGILQYLGMDISKIKVYDTMVIAKLYDNNLFKYDLESLSRKYLSQDLQKNKELLGEVVKKHKLLKSPKGNDCNIEAKTYTTRAIKWAYSHMDIIQELEPEIMAKYCNQDLIATGNLFLKMVEL